jgi:hypothetical protein
MIRQHDNGVANERPLVHRHGKRVAQIVNAIGQ